MNTEKQASQLELAAQIIRANHPWEMQKGDGFNAPNNGWENPAWCVAHNLEIRPVLAAPEDGRPIQNPRNLTAEQVGIGYKLTLVEQMDKKWHNDCDWWNGEAWNTEVKCWSWLKNDTIRIPLSTPWPKAKPIDPYAELKKAHAEGKTIQVNFGTQGNPDWQDGTYLVWCLNPNEYRIKPWTMPDPPAGREWHKPEALTQEDWEAGWRPALIGEKEGTDMELLHEDSYWRKPWADYGNNVAKNWNPRRTKRPLPTEKVPEHVPLEQKDISGGARLIWPDDKNRYSIQYDNEKGVEVDGVFYSYEWLMDKNVQILQAGETEPKPCHKLKN